MQRLNWESKTGILWSWSETNNKSYFGNVYIEGVARQCVAATKSKQTIFHRLKNGPESQLKAGVYRTNLNGNPFFVLKNKAHTHTRAYLVARRKFRLWPLDITHLSLGSYNVKLLIVHLRTRLRRDNGKSIPTERSQTEEPSTVTSKLHPPESFSSLRILNFRA